MPRHSDTSSAWVQRKDRALVGYAVRGAIWYQGEASACEGHVWRYRRLFAAMIQKRRNRSTGGTPFVDIRQPLWRKVTLEGTKG